VEEIKLYKILILKYEGEGLGHPVLDEMIIITLMLMIWRVN
jgi:hypothetical protein